MWRVMLIGIAVTLGACGDDDKPRDVTDVLLDIDPDMGEVDPDTTPDVEVIDPDTADGDVTPTPLASCLERADALPSPPGATLPCELVPPGLTLVP